MARVGEAARAALDRWRQLLDLEEREALERDRALYQEESPRTLEARGLLARGLLRLEEAPSVLGRVRWTLGEDPSRTGHLALFGARPGSVVALKREGEDELRGVVVRVERLRMQVVFDEPPDASYDERFDLLLLSDTVTLARLKKGLDACASAEGRAAELVEVLAGVRPPEPPAATPLDPIDPELNADQIEAARKALHADQVALIHGPFGTGKTTVLVEVVRQALARGERVLCLTASNAAVDHLCLSLLEREPELSLTRTGHPARAHPLLEAHTLAGRLEVHPRRKISRDVFDEAFGQLRQAERRSSRGPEGRRERREARIQARALFAEARKLERDAARDIVERTRVLAGTLTGYDTELPSGLRFDRVVIDEASQALTPAVLLGSLRADRVILAGDHRQLPPTVLSPKAAQGGLSSTVFEALIESTQGPSIGHMLTVQHRMHEDLMAFSSAQFYAGRLVAHPSVKRRTLRDLSVKDTELTLPDRPLDLVDTAGAGFEERIEQEGSSRENPAQAALTARFVRALIESGLTPDRIGVIAPYAAHVVLLHERLSEWTPLGLEIDTVDGFQGREKEAIVFDTVRSNAGGELGFLTDQRRLNVALTRARRKLVIIGDSATLAHDRVWAALFDTAIALGAHRSCFELSEDQE